MMPTFKISVPNLKYGLHPVGRNVKIYGNFFITAFQMFFSACDFARIEFSKDLSLPLLGLFVDNDVIGL
jgi:hypothetical protein